MSRQIAVRAEVPAPPQGGGAGPGWDPAQYRRFGDERGRAFDELLARVRCEDPREVVDLGCGPGELTAGLAGRWPRAHVLGIDASAEMIDAARRFAAARRADGTAAADLGSRLEFQVGDVATWRPISPVDVIISNAVLHWVPEHRELLLRWIEALAPGGRGWLAFQVPGNFDAPTHEILRELCASPRWRAWLGDFAPGRPVDDSLGYLDLLTGAGCEVDAWETTYAQVLVGDDPVLEWVKGTTLRPVLTAFKTGSAGSAGSEGSEVAGAEGPPQDGPLADFLAEYAERLRTAYPARPYGTVFPFRRVFVVARVPGRTGSVRASSPRSASGRSASERSAAERSISETSGSGPSVSGLPLSGPPT